MGGREEGRTGRVGEGGKKIGGKDWEGGGRREGRTEGRWEGGRREGQGVGLDKLCSILPIILFFYAQNVHLLFFL